MKRSTIETVLGALVLLTAAVFLIFSYKTAKISRDADGYELSATFSNIGSLGLGDSVQMAGVKIGVITDIHLTEYFEAEVVMTIDRGVQIPEDSAAVISSEGFLGGQILAIQPGGSMDILTKGDKITHTQPYVSLEELLGKFIYSAPSANSSGGNASSGGGDGGFSMLE